MSAIEIISELKKLPESERSKIVEFVKSPEFRAPEASVRYATKEQFNAAADEIFDQHKDLFRKLAQ